MDFFASAQQTTVSLIASVHQRPTVVLGLSGGPDSMFLLHVLHSLKQRGALKLVAAHLDHEWRPESGQDLLFCQKTCENLGVRFCSGKASVIGMGIKKNGSQEEFGRALRRTFLRKVMEEHQADCIALAHHLQDQQETFFIRLLRGATLDGLTGIKPIDGHYVRPLLEYNKSDILAYLADNNIASLTDPTNTSPAYLRNRIRATLIPAMKSIDQRFDAKFSTTLHSLTEENGYLETVAEQAFVSCFNQVALDAVMIGNLTTFASLHPVVQRRAVLIWLIRCKVHFAPSAGFIEEVIRFLHSPRGGKHAISSGHEIVKKKKNFWISSRDRC